MLCIFEMLDNVLLEKDSVLNSHVIACRISELHALKKNEFIGSAAHDDPPWRTCLNCFYPKCLHGTCQTLLSQGFGRGLQELEVLNLECRKMLLEVINQTERLDNSEHNVDHNVEHNVQHNVEHNQTCKIDDDDEFVGHVAHLLTLSTQDKRHSC